MIEVKGKNVEEAIEKGLKQLNLSREEVEIKILDEGASGLFGLMGAKPARVQLKPKKEGNLLSGDLLEILRNLFRQMKIKARFQTEKEEKGRIRVKINSPDSALLIGKKGATLDALELIVNLIYHKQNKSAPWVVLDTKSYRLRRERKAKQLAQEAAEEVKKTGKDYPLPPMSREERRAVHTLLKDDPEVETISQGEEENRRVIIRKKK
jgi:spoIIIJ-associated protein